MSRYVLCPSVRSGQPPKGMFHAEEYAAVDGFYAQSTPTPLHTLGNVLIKDESSRLGLNAFKILGVRYAVAQLKRQGLIGSDTVLCCATDGSHGRAVARSATMMGLRSHIYLPKHSLPHRIDKIANEGGEVHVVEGNYDDAVRQAAADAGQNGWLVVSDTAWPGYEEIPRWIMCGYTRLMSECAQQWTAPPDVVIVQAGVGGLAAAVASWLAHRFGQWRPYLICAQAANSPCIVEAARNGSPRRLEGSLETVMDCLSAGEASHTAWPVLSSVVDAYVMVEEQHAIDAVAYLKQHGVQSGYAGACGMAALLHLPPAVREAAQLSDASRMLMFVTEGPA